MGRVASCSDSDYSFRSLNAVGGRVIVKLPKMERPYVAGSNNRHTKGIKALRGRENVHLAAHSCFTQRACFCCVLSCVAELQVVIGVVKGDCSERSRCKAMSQSYRLGRLD